MGSAIMAANMKGGVGKSTLTCYLADYFRKFQKKRVLSLIDTDLQGSTYEMLGTDGRFANLRHLPVGDRYDAVNLVTVDTLVRSHLSTANDLLLIDTSAGKPDNICQIAMMCHCSLYLSRVSISTRVNRAGRFELFLTCVMFRCRWMALNFQG